MRTARFFVPAEWIAESAKAFSIPAGPLHKQITMVLRLKAGDEISLLPNDGTEFTSVITEINRSSVMGTIGVRAVGKPLAPNITVCAALTKGDSFEWMLEKCTELGASTFIPLITDRTIKRTKENPARLNLILKEAAEQSGRTSLPLLLDPMTLSAALKDTEKTVRIAMHETGGAALPKIHKTNDLALFVGPEGGFTDEEIATLKNAGAHLVTFGNLVFRAETAAVVGTTLLRFL
jgi:16S rRNA (uracil1498-N3)-methyltransferase